MAAIIFNYYKRNHYLKWLTIVILVSSAILLSGKVFSVDGKERNIIFNNDTWELADDFTKEWFFFGERVTFEMDLSDDYQQSSEVSEIPFTLSATYNGVNTDISIEPIFIEVEAPEVPGEPEEPQDPVKEEETNGSDNSGDHSNIDENTNTDETQDNTEGHDEEAEAEVPGEDTGNAGAEQDEQEVQEPTFEFTGRYTVEIVIPTQADGVLDVSLQFPEDNDWEIPGFSRDFYFEKDSTAPIISLVNPDELDEVIFQNNVSVQFFIEDANIHEENVVITIFKDEEESTKQWDVVVEDNGIFFETTFGVGEYEITVNARDNLNQEADTYSAQFVVRGTGNTNVELNVSDKDGDITPYGYTRYSKIDLELRNDNKPLREVMVEGKNGDQEEYSKITERTIRPARRTVDLSLSNLVEGTNYLRITTRERNLGFDPGKTEVIEFTFTVDTTNPEVEIGGVGNGGKYNEFPDLTVLVSDANINSDEPATVSVKKEGTTVLGTNDFELLENEDGSFVYRLNGSEYNAAEGLYEITSEVIDLAGNKSEQSILFTIDKTKPVIEIAGVEENGHYNKPTVTITVEDLHLNMDQTTVLVQVWDGNEWVESDESITLRKNGNIARAEHTFIEDHKYKLTVESVDEAGNTNDLSKVFTNDTTAPILIIEGVEDGEEYKHPFVEENSITLRVQDVNVDVSQTNVTVTKTSIHGETQTLTVDELEPISDIELANSYSFAEDGIYVIEFDSTDKAGNSTIHPPLTFTLDKTSPSISITGVEENEHSPSNKEVTISVEDLTLDVKATDLEVLKDGKVYNRDFDKEQVSDFLVEFTHLFTEEGTYEIYVTSTDRVENVETKESMKFVIDKTSPVITLSGIDDGAFIQRGNVEVQVVERYYETNIVEVLVRKDNEEYTHDRFPLWENTGAKSTIVLPFDSFNEDGKYEIVVTAVDHAGNKAERKKLSFTLDNTKPTISVSDVERYSNRAQTVKVDVTEKNYANNDVKVEVTKKHPVTKAIVSTHLENWENKEVNSSKHYTFDEEFEYTVRVTATDAAGNKADAKSVTFTIDKVKPELTIAGIESGEHYKSKQVEFTVKDTTIDLEKTSIKITRNKTHYDKIGALRMKSGSKTTASISHIFKDEGNYVVAFESTDKAGNKYVHEEISFVIDSTNPVVKIDGVENNSFNPSNKTVTVSVDELNYETNDVVLQVTKDNQPYSMGQWRNSGKLSQLSHLFSEDGLYTIAITATDKAGNGPISQTITFTIDKTNPEIEITGVENEAHYNMDRPVQVRITDTNIETNRITVTRNGAAYNVGGFSVSGNTAALNHTFSREGVYVIQVEAVDKAGNRTTDSISFVIDKTPPEITPMMSGENRVLENGEYINRIFTPSFVLSESEDTLSSVTLNGRNVTGNIPTASRDMIYNYVVRAVDKAGNETTLEISFTLDITNPTLEIKGVIEGFFNNDISPEVTYSDTNLDTSRTNVTLNDEPFVNGTRLEQEQDYVLRAIVTDLANNVSSRTIAFTIDKTAPTIRFAEPISNQYFNSFVIPDFIIDSLSPYEIIAMTLNGQPYNLGDPIEQEGLHVLYFELKDSAGNITQLSVEFVIDLTPPTVVYEGVDIEEIYYEPVELSIRLDNPNDKIKSVTINGDLFTGETFTENGFEVIRTTLTAISEYEVVVEAFDEAGNETTFTLPFEIAEKSLLVKYYENTTLFAGSIVGLLGFISAGISVVVMRRKKVKARDEEIELEE